MELLLFVHVPADTNSSLFGRDLLALRDSALMHNISVVPVPFPLPENPQEILRSLPAPDLTQGSVAVYAGPIPHPDGYAALEEYAAAAGWEMLNTAAASLQATELRHWYPLLTDLTARTIVVQTTADLAAAATFTWPAFVKTNVKSAKENGWDACIVQDAAQLRERVELLRPAVLARGGLAVRELLPLRPAGPPVMGFPQSREFRVLLLDGQVLFDRFYWTGTDTNGPLTDNERGEMHALACEAAGRLDARLLMVDVGQLQDGSWKIIEVGDAQHSAFVHTPLALLWPALQEASSDF